MLSGDMSIATTSLQKRSTHSRSSSPSVCSAPSAASKRRWPRGLTSGLLASTTASLGNVSHSSRSRLCATRSASFSSAKRAGMLHTCCMPKSCSSPLLSRYSRCWRKSRHCGGSPRAAASLSCRLVSAVRIHSSTPASIESSSSRSGSPEPPRRRTAAGGKRRALKSAGARCMARCTARCVACWQAIWKLRIAVCSAASRGKREVTRLPSSCLQPKRRSKPCASISSSWLCSSSDAAPRLPPCSAAVFITAVVSPLQTIAAASLTKASICTAFISPVVCSLLAGGKRRCASGRGAGSPDSAHSLRSSSVRCDSSDPASAPLAGGASEAGAVGSSSVPLSTASRCPK
mmetsp:Transcript_7800/g.19338  ORF Transcript_7800/g.19338 Transcript_7800/m.19338 type:complete len:346 (-) Transcript_7800:346-1383(-)